MRGRPQSFVDCVECGESFTSFTSKCAYCKSVNEAHLPLRSLLAHRIGLQAVLALVVLLMLVGLVWIVGGRTIVGQSVAVVAIVWALLSGVFLAVSAAARMTKRLVWGDRDAALSVGARFVTGFVAAVVAGLLFAMMIFAATMSSGF